MKTIYSGRKTKKKSPAPFVGAVCALICAVSLVIFSEGGTPLPVSSPAPAEDSFWEDYSQFVAGLFER